MAKRKARGRQLGEKTIEYYRSRPEVLDEKEFRKRINETIVYRYEKLDEAVDALEAIADGLNASSDEKKRFSLAIEEVDAAISAFANAHVGHNRCAKASIAAHARPILWFNPKGKAARIKPHK